jgi:hypothetical protein
MPTDVRFEKLEMYLHVNTLTNLKIILQDGWSRSRWWLERAPRSLLCSGHRYLFHSQNNRSLKLTARNVFVIRCFSKPQLCRPTSAQESLLNRNNYCGCRILIICDNRLQRPACNRSTKKCTDLWLVRFRSVFADALSQLLTLRSMDRSDGAVCWTVLRVKWYARGVFKTIRQIFGNQ